MPASAHSPPLSPLARAIRAVLLGGFRSKVAAQLLVALLLRKGFARWVTRAAVWLAGRLPASARTPTGPAGKITRDAEVDFRSAYIATAATRLQARRSDPVKALRAEKRYFSAHVAAVRHRAAAAGWVDSAAAINGPTLGWYLGPPFRHTPVCRAAAGHNFSALHAPVCGWPGTTHARCACYPGPPFPGAGTVDAAVRRLVAMGAD